LNAAKQRIAVSKGKTVTDFAAKGEMATGWRHTTGSGFITRFEIESA
jgi:hypothetical protein